MYYNQADETNARAIIDTERVCLAVSSVSIQCLHKLASSSVYAVRLIYTYIHAPRVTCFAVSSASIPPPTSFLLHAAARDRTRALEALFKPVRQCTPVIYHGGIQPRSR